MTQKIYCEDCKFFFLKPGITDKDLARCGRPLQTPPLNSYVSRDYEQEAPFCSNTRGNADRCGLDAKWFEPK